MAKRKVSVFFLVLATAALVFSGCAKEQKEEEKEEVGIETIKEGILTAGSDVAYPPFEYKDEKTQEDVGFDIDLITEIANRLGLKVEIVNATFDTLIPALNAKKYDVVVSAMTITEEREKQVDFSDSYIDSDQSIAVRKDSAIAGAAELKDKVVGVQRGTTGELKAKELKETYGIKEIKSYDDTLLAFEDLKAGRVDAVINDLPVTAYLVTKDPAFKIVEVVKTGEKYGFAFRKDSKELREKVNEALEEIKEDGTYDRIYKKWFGETE